MRCALLILALMLPLTGCAKYEYDLVRQPGNSTTRASHIGRNMDAVAIVEPLEYRMRTVDNRLVVRIFNQSEDNIQLIGERSSIVDPDGQSHPLRGGPIAPHSFLKLIIPPPRPQVYQSNPTFGVGVGVGVSNHHYHRHPYYHTWYRDYYDYFGDRYGDPFCRYNDEPYYF